MMQELAEMTRKEVIVRAQEGHQETIAEMQKELEKALHRLQQKEQDQITITQMKKEHSKVIQEHKKVTEQLRKDHIRATEDLTTMHEVEKRSLNNTIRILKVRAFTFSSFPPISVRYTWLIFGSWQRSALYYLLLTN